MKHKSTYRITFVDDSVIEVEASGYDGSYHFYTIPDDGDVRYKKWGFLVEKNNVKWVEMIGETNVIWRRVISK
jgi:hypothetical protein